jgi:hypothetical protein
MSLIALAAASAILGTPSTRFDPVASAQTVVACTYVYNTLESATARSPDPSARTNGRVTAFRARTRLAPFVEAVSKANRKADLDELSGAIGLVVGAMSSSEEKAGPKQAPDETGMKLLSDLITSCDRQLTAWGARQSTALPPEVSGHGHARFQLHGKTADQAFADDRTAAIAAAACDGSADDLRKAIQAGGQINGEGLRRETPLVFAVACERREAIEILLDAGADPNLPRDADFFGPPMSVASEKADPKFLKMLLDHGGDPNAGIGYRHLAWNAMMIGHNRGDWRAWNLLLSAGLDYSRPRPFDTDLDALAMSGHYDKVWELLQRGYNGDLVVLARTITTAEERPSGARAAPDRDKVKAYLQAHGVSFPVPALIQLKKGPDGRYIQ